jgi:hypothetical protein
MISAMLLIQAASQNIAMFFCALFAGSSVYISLVEDPATAEGGPEMAGAYLVTAHPRPAIVQASFATTAALAGIVTGLAGGATWWFIGGVILGVAALIQLFVVIPLTRRLTDVDPEADPKRVNRLLLRLTRLHGALCLASLAAIFIFIMKT